jgi:hypothetical protein
MKFTGAMAFWTTNPGRTRISGVVISIYNYSHLCLGSNKWPTYKVIVNAIFIIYLVSSYILRADIDKTEKKTNAAQVHKSALGIIFVYKK